jgi:hypothetical protein
MRSLHSKSLTTYVAGPMSGRKDHNFPAFFDAEAKLRRRGWIVINPAAGHWNKKRDRPWRYYMIHDIAKLVHCDAVTVLPGWKKSRGARLEVTIARRLGMPVFEYVTGKKLW